MDILPLTKQIDISAVVLSFNSIKYLHGCCEALLNSFDSLGVRGEIYVVENGSLDGSREKLEELVSNNPGRIFGIYSPVNTGTTVSRNMALRQVNGQKILVIDSDATCNAEALSSVLAELDGHPECGLAVPRLVYKDGRHQISVDQFPTLWRKVQRLFGLRGLEEKYEVPTTSIEVDYAISAFWLLRRETIVSTGELDENIFYSPEDVDYCLRVWMAGWTIRYVPQFQVTHDAQELSRSKKLNGFIFRHAGGLAYYFNKHGYLLGLSGIRAKISTAVQKRKEKIEQKM
jgi:GT2 family glycosyltransferase